MGAPHVREMSAREESNGAYVEPTIVFVHGLFQGFSHFRELAFPAPARILVLDLMGYGEHKGESAPTTIRPQVEHVLAELDRLGVARATLVGQSVGGAVSMLVAASHPERVSAVVNVEGNFTLADAFWSSNVAAQPPHEVAAMLDGFRNAPATWLKSQGIDPTPERLVWTDRMFAAQPPSSLQGLAKAVVEATARPEYLRRIEAVLDAEIPLHLVAGERSRSGWAVPDSFARRATSFTIQPGVGHMMSIEDPQGFLAIVAERTTPRGPSSS